MVHQLKEVDAALRDAGQAEQEGHPADEEHEHLVAAEMPLDPAREAVLQRGGHHLHHGKLRIQPQAQHHEEEAHRPELRRRHLRHGLRVQHEHQTRA